MRRWGSGRDEGRSFGCRYVDFLNVVTEGAAAGLDLDGIVPGLARAAGEVGGAEFVEVIVVRDGFELAVLIDGGDAGGAAEGGIAS